MLTMCILSAFGTPLLLNTEQAKAEKTCSNRSLKGAYEFQWGGYLNKKNYVLNALITFDGNGKVMGTILVRNVDGNITINLPTQGTYKIKSDCSITTTFTRRDGTTANYSGVVYDDGKKLGLTETDITTVVNLKGERVSTSY